MTERKPLQHMDPAPPSGIHRAAQHPLHADAMDRDL